MHHLTPEQIAELREDLLRMRNRLIKQAEEQIRDPSDVTFQGGDEIDRANIETGRYINLQRIRTRELKLLRKIDYALMKMENETYGICEGCGVFIPFERLKARPVTTMCINCKELEEEGENE
ncbi:MAG: TraR/DksA C4-type zinc finger protein [Aquificaceae bacterium]|nr:TraR/DksA family transcriptional regulator [Aquificaceae bacterium]MDW8066780.1 TraR/DksA C4-type zinc finger protein [Aquificaceae bacterium]MDW8422805.1 TraR/DksA C4-type zinc finger protein [Aquificaceae bacterium]